MGRNPAPWLGRAHDLLADGDWQPRSRIISEMIKLVPPGKALRRGQTLRGRKDLPQAEMIYRGARHICLNSLRDGARLELKELDGEVLVRLLRYDPPTELVMAADQLTWEVLRRIAEVAERAQPGLLDELPLRPDVLARLHPD